jgi:hypothetical protein
MRYACSVCGLSRPGSETLVHTNFTRMGEPEVSG